MHRLLDPDDMPPWVASLWPQGRRPSSVVAGVNDDDCAVMKWRSGWLIVTTDFINANPIAMELGIGTLWDLGRLIVAANLSDLCGSGANPVALLIGVTLPHGSTHSEYQEVMRGVKFEADRHRVPVVGGDSKLGRSRALMGVALGSARSRSSLFLKNGARPGDLIWVSGHLGSVAASVWGFGRKELRHNWKRWARTSLLSPRLPLALSRAISRARLGHGGTDISDGFGADLTEMCRASEVGAVVDAGNIPFAPAVREAAKLACVPPWRFAFASGGDFQFFVTTSRRNRGAMQRLGLYEIGEITEHRSVRLRMPNGSVGALPARGHRDSRRMTFAEEIDALINSENLKR